MMSIYTRLFRPLAFRLDPETAHHLAIAAGARLGWAAGAMRAVTQVDDARLASEVAGLHFPTPIGLAAGFDKSGSAIAALASLGFGAVEIGSISIEPSQGNAKPRLWRLPDDEAIVVHYGLPNDGAAAIAERLARTRLPVPLGINLVVTNRGPGTAPLNADQIIGEYAAAAKAMAPHADYLMLNLSCPNTVDGRDFFADAGHLDAQSLARRAVGPIGGDEPVGVDRVGLAPGHLDLHPHAVAGVLDPEYLVAEEDPGVVLALHSGVEHLVHPVLRAAQEGRGAVLGGDLSDLRGRLHAADLGAAEATGLVACPDLDDDAGEALACGRQGERRWRDGAVAGTRRIEIT